MLFLEPENQGPHDPITATPDRAPSSVRRTTSIDTWWPDGFSGDAEVRAGGRDLLTPADPGEPRVLSTADLRLQATGAGREIVDATSSTHPATAANLLGLGLSAGLRRRIDGALGGLDTIAGPLRLLLDDLAGASLVSGYAMLRAGIDMGPTDPEAFGTRAGLCAGWAADGVMFSAVREHRRVPTPVGPPAPDLDRDDDPCAWHDLGDLPQTATRRRRRIDLVADGSFDAMFRDSHVDADGAETTVHEYAVSGTVDPVSRTVKTITVTAHVLPWVECPGAAASAQRLVGRPISQVRGVVGNEFRGVSTCTHLNDTLRGLGDLDPLAGVLAARASMAP